MHFNSAEISKLDKLYRINLINSCTGFKSANLIGTISNDNIENVAVFSSVTHFGSNPPLVGFVTRPLEVKRDTYENIKTNGFFTINHINASNFIDAHHTSAKYPSTDSEFDFTELKSEYKDDFIAPYVQNCAVQMGLQFKEEYHIKANGTILILGEIKHLYVKDTILEKDGFINLTEGGSATINGLDTYAFPNEYKRLEYQRPKK